MPVHWIWEQKSYEIKEKLSNGQTIFIQFQKLEDTKDYKNYNICLGIYSKRKHAVINEAESRITGKSPFLNIYKIIRMFNEIENYVIEETLRQGNNICLIVAWTDNRRRDAYYKVLSKRGYNFEVLQRQKCLVKRITVLKQD